MGKLKAGICPGCNEKLLRHDTARVQVRVSHSQNGVFKEAHLGCQQDSVGTNHELEIRKKSGR